MRYRRRYRQSAHRVPTRKEAIEDAAFADAEADGACPYDREEALLSAIYYTLGRIAAAHGVDMAQASEIAADTNAVRPRRRAALSTEERERETEAATRRDFAPMLARAKAALRRRGTEGGDV